MTSLRVAAVVLACLVAQLAVFVDVRVAGAAPELLAVVTVLVALRLGPEQGAVVGFAAGALWDVYLPTPLGVAALAYALAGHVAGLAAVGLHDEARWQRVALGGLGSALAVTTYAVVGWILGGTGLVGRHLLTLVPLLAVVDTVAAAVIDPLVGWAVRPPRVRAGEGRGHRGPASWWTLGPRW